MRTRRGRWRWNIWPIREVWALWEEFHPRSLVYLHKDVYLSFYYSVSTCYKHYLSALLCSPAAPFKSFAVIIPTLFPYTIRKSFLLSFSSHNIVWPVNISNIYRDSIIFWTQTTLGQLPDGLCRLVSLLQE